MIKKKISPKKYIYLKWTEVRGDNDKKYTSTEGKNGTTIDTETAQSGDRATRVTQALYTTTR